MSTAPNLETLFNVEPAVEDGWKSLLAAQSPSVPPGFAQREQDGLPDERIDIECTLGKATGHRHKDSNGNHWLDAWNAQIKLTIGTARKRVDPSGVDAKTSEPTNPTDPHNLARARIRILAQYASDSFPEAHLPYHTLTKIQEAGTSPTILGSDDCDASEITFDCLISIRSNAWPAV